MAKKKNENVDEIAPNNEELLNQDETQAVEDLSLNIGENEPNIEENDESLLDEQLEDVEEDNEQPDEVVEEEKQPDEVVIDDKQPDEVVDDVIEDLGVALEYSEPKESKNIDELNYSQYRHYLRTGRIPK